MNSAPVAHHARRATVIIDRNLIADDPDGHSDPFVLACGADSRRVVGDRAVGDWGKVTCPKCISRRDPSERQG